MPTPSPPRSARHRHEQIETLLAIIAGESRINRALLVLLLRDMFVRRFRTSALVVAMSIGNVIIQASSIGLIFVYISLLETGQSVDVAGWSLFFTGTSIELISAAVAAGILVFASALMAYLARRVIVAEGIQYYRDNVAAASHALQRLRESSELEQRQPPDHVLRSIFAGDIRYASAGYTLILSALLPLFTLITAFSALLYMMPILGSIIVLALLGLSPLYLRVFEHGHDIQVELRQRARENAADKASLVNAITRNPIHRWNKDEDTRRWLRHGPTEEFLDVLAKRQRLSDSASVAAHLGMSAAIAGFIFYIGQQIAAGGDPIAGIATLLLVFRYMLSAFNGLVTQGANLHAMLPLFVRLLAFRRLGELVRSIECTPLSPCPAPPTTPSHVAVFTPRHIGQAEARRLAQRLWTEDEEPYTALVSSELTPYYWDWSQDLTAGSWELPHDGQTFSDRFPAWRSREREYENLVRRPPHARFSVADLKRISKGLRLFFTLQTSLARRAPIVVIQADDLDGTRPMERRWIEEQLASRKAIYVYQCIPTDNTHMPVDRVYVEREGILSAWPDTTLGSKTKAELKKILQQEHQRYHSGREIRPLIDLDDLDGI